MSGYQRFKGSATGEYDCVGDLMIEWGEVAHRYSLCVSVENSAQMKESLDTYFESLNNKGLLREAQHQNDEKG